jgi:hypothetical protein
LCQFFITIVYHPIIYYNPSVWSLYGGQACGVCKSAVFFTSLKLHLIGRILHTEQAVADS